MAEKDENHHHNDAPWVTMQKLVVGQLHDNVKAIKEIGDNFHRLSGFVDKIPYEVAAKLTESLSKLKEEIRAERDREIKALTDRLERNSSDLEDRLEKQTVEYSKKIEQFSKDIAVLQVKAGIWGAIGAIVGVLGIWLANQLGG